MEYQKKNKYILLLIIFTVLGSFIFMFVNFTMKIPSSTKGGNTSPLLNLKEKKENNKFEMEAFSSVEEFKTYIAQSKNRSDMNMGLPSIRNSAPMLGDTMEFDDALESTSSKQSLKSEPNRVSETNVQVAGIDEPDIVKTDGENLFYSQEKRYAYIMEDFPVSNVGVSMPRKQPEDDSKTQIMQAFPVEKLKKRGELKKNGQLLLEENTLLVIEDNHIITAFDVSDPADPKETWDMKLDEAVLVQSRKVGDKVYLITRTYVNHDQPCPIRPLSIDGKEIEISCVDIYHPQYEIDVNVTYSVLAVDIHDGKVDNSISFVGSSGGSTVYMNEENIFVTYHKSEDMVKITSDFYEENSDLYSDDVKKQIKKLAEYEISSQAKMIEFNLIMERYLQSLDKDKRLEIESETQNRMKDYLNEQKRKMDFTAIVKISVDKLEVENTGTVPGTLLNQFSMDEYEGNLRVAVTVGNANSFRREGTKSANDVYVLNEKLNQTGAILDLGLEERIYSARFMGDKGYLVTFRETDPFYILDLSNPEKPKKTGELKIPGYSSYLHPFANNLILGVGREDGKVKLSLFDVKDPENPKEVSKYMLDEYYSEAVSNHHAFMADEKFEVFFIPGGKGGYVFSYEGGKLSLIKAIDGKSVKRAIYIDENLYVISEEKISVYNENNWGKIKEIEL